VNDKYTDPQVQARRDAIDRIVQHMREHGMSSEAEFTLVHQSMLPERSAAAFASGLLGITWPDVKERLGQL
jgi:hypothetical protein